MGERVLEGIGTFGKQAGFVEKLCRLEVRQTAIQRLVWRVGNGLQQRPGHLGANDRSGLEQAFVLRRQAVDAGGKYGLDCGRHRHPLERLYQAIGPWGAHQDSRLD